MKKLIILLILFCLTCLFVIPAFGFYTHDTTISRTFDKESAVVGESITTTVSFVNLEVNDMRGFYYTEQIPLGLSIGTVSVKINGSNISYFAEPGISGEVYADYTPYRWILELPPSFGENNPVSQDSMVEIVYTVTSSNAGAFNFDEFNWVGYYQDAPVGMRSAFGHNEDADKQTITFTVSTMRVSEIIGTWDNGIWYWDVAASTWTQMTSYTTTGDIAAGDLTGDGKADVASSRGKDGLWYQDGVSLDWTKIDGSPPFNVTAGDVTGDGRDEIIGTWTNGIWYLDVAASTWTQMTSESTTGDLAAGDFSGDGKADVASIWNDQFWYQDGATLAWIKIDSLPPYNVTAGDVTGDGRDEIIGTWANGIWYLDLAASTWTQMTTDTTTGDLAAGDFTGDGKADVASIWNDEFWYQDGATLVWTKVPGTAPVRLTAGDVTGQ